VTVGTTSVSRSIHPAWDKSSPVCPSVIADAPDAVILDKRNTTGEAPQWNVVTEGSQYDTTNLDHPTRLGWLDDTYYVATVPNVAACDSGNNTGRLVLFERDADGEVDAAALSHTVGDVDNKPEGMDAVAIDTGLANTTCKTGGILYADWVVYVGDFCNDRIHVFTVDTATGAEHVTHRMEVSINDTDLSGDCHPSSLRYDSERNVIVVLCQLRGSILNVAIDSDDQCSISYDSSSEAALQYINGPNLPSCETTPGVTNCMGVCQPHSIDYDFGISDDWLFVGLSEVGQVTAVRADDHVAQAVVFKHSSYIPKGLVVVGD